MRIGKIIRLFSVPLVGVLAATAMALPASAAVDRTPPKLTMPPYVQFVQGATLGDEFWMDDQSSFNYSIPVTIGWKATDASRICGYDLWEERVFDGEYLLLSNTRRTSYSTTTSDYENQFGGGGGWIGYWTVVARDCAGNQTSKTAAVSPSIIQENSFSPDDYWADISYTGTWSASQCWCYSGRGAYKTTSRGARAVISFESSANAAVGLVMEKAPNRGRFTLLVDGVNRGTIDTFAATNLHKVTVWSGRMTSAGHHVIELVNQATGGRPRIDLDAVLRVG